MQRIGSRRRNLVQFLPGFLIRLVGLHVVGRYAVSILILFAVHDLLLLSNNAGGKERVRAGTVGEVMGLSAQQAAARAGKGGTVIGWKLDPRQRLELLQQFPPKFSEIIADHVTLAARASATAELPEEIYGEIVGRIDDGRGVEAMVVEIGGSADRPDGSIYHITWSLAAGRKAKESNDVIRDLGWIPLDLPMPVELKPDRF